MSYIMISKSNTVDNARYTISEGFNHEISTIIRLIDSKHVSNKEDMDRVKRLINIAKNELPFEIIETCMKPILNASDHIIEKNENFFLSQNYNPSGANKDLILSLISMIKESHSKFNNVEKNRIWSILQTMLKLVTEYALICR